MFLEWMEEEIDIVEERKESSYIPPIGLREESFDEHEGTLYSLCYCGTLDWE